MTDAIEAAIAKQLERAEALSATDLAALADASRSAAEEKQIRDDGEFNGKKVGFERWKTFSLFVVPLVSLLSLAATSIVQSMQAGVTGAQEEMKQWREFLKTNQTIRDGAIDGDASQKIDAIVPQLSSFLSSPYRPAGPRWFSLDLLGRVSKVDSFRELFEVTFPAGQEADLQDLAHVSRVLTTRYRGFWPDCKQSTDRLTTDTREAIRKGVTLNAYGFCDGVVGSSLETSVADDKPTLEHIRALRKALEANYEESRIVSNAICAQVRGLLSPESGAQRARNSAVLAGVHLINCDLSRLDFSGMDLSQTWFEYDELRDANFQPQKIDGMEVGTSDFWNARSISRNVLETTAFWYLQWLREDPLRVEECKKQFSDCSIQTIEARVKQLCGPAACSGEASIVPAKPAASGSATTK